MRYILKLYYDSKYIGYEHIEYKEFDSYKDIVTYLLINKNFLNYEIYEKK